MEQRREPRFETDQPVEITVLGDLEVRLAARVRNASGRGLALETTEAVAPGTALRIDLDDAVVLGEAVYCRPGSGTHLIGVELDQVLCGLAELGRRLQEFAEPASERQVAYSVKHRNGQNSQKPKEQ
jgi:hypothetical protein